MKDYSQILTEKREQLKAGAYGFNFVQRVNLLNLIAFMHCTMQKKKPEITLTETFSKVEASRVKRDVFPTAIDKEFKYPLLAEIESMLEIKDYFEPSNYGLKTAKDVLAAINKIIDEAYVPF